MSVNKIRPFQKRSNHIHFEGYTARESISVFIWLEKWEREKENKDCFVEEDNLDAVAGLARTFSPFMRVQKMRQAKYLDSI